MFISRKSTQVQIRNCWRRFIARCVAAISGAVVCLPTGSGLYAGTGDHQSDLLHTGRAIHRYYDLPTVDLEFESEVASGDDESGELTVLEPIDVPLPIIDVDSGSDPIETEAPDKTSGIRTSTEPSSQVQVTSHADVANELIPTSVASGGSGEAEQTPIQLDFRPAAVVYYEHPGDIGAGFPVEGASQSGSGFDGGCCEGDGCATCCNVSSCCPPLCGCDACRCRLWFRAEYLMMWTSGYDLPALLTSSPAGTPGNQLGVLGAPETDVVFGQSSFGDRTRFGGRLTGGVWLDDCRRIGIQGDFLALSDDDAGFSTTLPNAMPLARPFFNEDTGMQDSQLLNSAGVADGSIDFNFSSRVYSAGPALRWQLCCCGGCDPCDPCGCEQRTDGILGYRYFGLNETFQAREVLTPTGPFDVPGSRFELNDRIEVENEFHGVEFGLNRMGQRDRWFYELHATCAIGELTRRVSLDGSSRRFSPGLVDSQVPGGFLVPAQNIMTRSDRSYAILPQLRLNLGTCLRNNWRVYGGYNLMYLSNAYRVGDFVDPRFSGQQLAANAVPSLSNVPRPGRQDVFLHGVTIGIGKNF